jgi:hypothetical protein
MKKIKQKKWRKTSMIKFVINLIELYFIGWFLIKTVKIVLFKKNRDKSILGKCCYLVTKKIHRLLDKKIAYEKSLVPQAQSSKVVPFKKRKVQ